jgi:hypothetical protein
MKRTGRPFQILPVFVLWVPTLPLPVVRHFEKEVQIEKDNRFGKRASS